MADNIKGIDAIIEKIREYGDQTAQKLIDESSERADSIFSEAEEEVEAFTAESEKSLEAELRLLESQSEGDYAAVVRDRTLAMKQELLARTFERAAVLLSELPDDRKLALYRKWISENGEDCSYSVILNRTDKKEFGEILRSEMERGMYPGRPTVSEYVSEALGGLILDFGDSRTDITFETVAFLQKGSYDTELIKILFPEG